MICLAFERRVFTSESEPSSATYPWHCAAASLVAIPITATVPNGPSQITCREMYYIGREKYTVRITRSGVFY